MQVWLPARAHVKIAIEKRKSVDGSGEIILLETICPWKDHLYELEEEMGVETPLKYCIYEVRIRLWPMNYGITPSSTAVHHEIIGQVPVVTGMTFNFSKRSGSQTTTLLMHLVKVC
jgi:uncharacterized UPF0160 family protein